jgi:hypothetical protein
VVGAEPAGGDLEPSAGLVVAPSAGAGDETDSKADPLPGPTIPITPAASLRRADDPDAPAADDPPESPG